MSLKDEDSTPLSLLTSPNPWTSLSCSCTDFDIHFLSNSLNWPKKKNISFLLLLHWIFCQNSELKGSSKRRHHLHIYLQMDKTSSGHVTSGHKGKEENWKGRRQARPFSFYQQQAFKTHSTQARCAFTFIISTQVSPWCKMLPLKQTDLPEYVIQLDYILCPSSCR